MPGPRGPRRGGVLSRKVSRREVRLEAAADGGMAASFREWRAAWGRDRARRVARDYAPVRDCVRFWASFGTVEDDGGDGGGRSRRGAQRSGFGFGIGIGIDGRPLRRPLREGGAGSARGRTRRGVPRVPRLLPSNGARGFAAVGVGGAFDGGACVYFFIFARMRKTDVAFVCSQGIRSRRARDVPVRIVRVRVRRGIFPVLDRPRAARRARRALHEQVPNGFRLRFTRRGIAAGSESRRGGDWRCAPGRMDRSRSTRRSRRANGGWRCAGARNARGRPPRRSANGNRARGGTRRAEEGAPTGVERELAGARMDAAVCKSLVDSTSELRRRAMRAMRSVTDAGVDALREAEAAAVDAARVVFDSAKTRNGETAAKTVGRGTARSS